MVIANLIKAANEPPKNWSTNTLNRNMIEADKLYSQVRLLSEENQIPEPGYLLVADFNIVKNDIIMYGKSFSIEFGNEANWFGSVKDRANTDIGKPVIQAFTELFHNHQAGLLISSGKSYGVMHYDDKYYFTDSHSCGPQGAPAANGRACNIECDNIGELNRICKRATSCKNIQYTLNAIDVHIKPNIIINEQAPIDHQELIMSASDNINNDELPEPIAVNFQQSQVQSLPISSSIMAPIDAFQPDVEEELEVSSNLNEIKRKTNNNIVNEAHELRAEEFSWFSLFPYGKNGLKENRVVKITPLDYFQFRILGADSRFQRTDYLFYALSMYELHKIKSTISACGKKIQGQDGQVEDIHLYLKNLRGSAAYWRTALNELLAHIRCLGAPTYFLTFSCNDLHWVDMKKALLVADGRPNDDPTKLDVYLTQMLIETYPEIICRHFMVRVNAILILITNSGKLFGGKVTDFWWRIEFQNRGSPHLHLVIWIGDHPSFETPEGIQRINENCACEMPTEEMELREIVKKCQLHHHTETCKKNQTDCRFGFPRSECLETKIVAHSSDDFIRSGGRICILKRSQNSRWVNNYHPKLLQIWNGNMDIQPCGSNEAIAFYIAKYISKSEPTSLNSAIADAIKQIRLEQCKFCENLKFLLCSL